MAHTTRPSHFKGHHHLGKGHVPKHKDSKTFERDMLKEQREHPSFSKNQVRQIVSDHHKGVMHRAHKHTDIRPFHERDVDMRFPKRTAILVPATKNGNEPISKAEHARRVQETERFMSKQYGGYTAIQGRGGYVNEQGQLIEEPVTEVVAYTDEPTYVKRRENVREFLRDKRSEWSQDSIGYEQDNNAQLYYFKGS